MQHVCGDRGPEIRNVQCRKSIMVVLPPGRVVVPDLPMTLPFTPPLDWAWLREFFATRAIAGVEAVVDGAYVRTVDLRHEGRRLRGWLRVACDDGAALEVILSPSLRPACELLRARLRQQFDLNAPRGEIHAALGEHAARLPGLAVPGAFDGFEVVVRGILGQQITVAAASTLTGRVAQTLGEPIDTPFAELSHTFPTAGVLAATPADTLGGLGIVGSRIRAIHGLAVAYEAGDIELTPQADVMTTMKSLKALHGIGDWTANYAAMRALHWADAFPAADYGILKALGMSKPAEARKRAEAWRPWRAYAAIALWRSLADD